MPIQDIWPKTAPNVVGDDTATAESALNALLIPFAYGASVNSDTVAIGLVAAQDHAAGSTMNLGDIMGLALSLGPAITGVPMQVTIYGQLNRNLISERSAFHAFIKFYDDSTYPWTLVTPTTVDYRVDCETTGAILRDWTALTPATSIDLVVTSSDNAITRNSDPTERRVLTVRCDNGLDTQESKDFRWRVKNLQGQY